MPQAASEPSAHLAAFRAELGLLLSSWRKLARRAEPSARAEAEAQVFAQMTVALHHACTRCLARPEPAALTELRLLAQGVTANGGYFPSDPAAHWRRETSITGHGPGDRIRLTEPAFTRLTEASLAATTA
jgi:hypothetical protein